MGAKPERPRVDADAWAARVAKSKVVQTTDHAALRSSLLTGAAAGAAGGGLALAILSSYGLLRKSGQDARFSRILVVTCSVCVPMLIGANYTRLTLRPPNGGRGTGRGALTAASVQTPVQILSSGKT